MLFFNELIDLWRRISTLLYCFYGSFHKYVDIAEKAVAEKVVAEKAVAENVVAEKAVAE